MAAIGATGAAGGAAVGGVLGIVSGAIENAYAQHNARKAYSRQKRLMQMQYQWMVNDLRAAGLNPALAFGARPGAPSAPMAQSPGDFDIVEGAQRGISSARDIAQMTDVLKMIKAQRGVAEKERDAAVWLPHQRHADVSVTLRKAQEIKASHDLLVAQKDQAKVNAQLLRYELPEARANARLYEATGGGLKFFEKLRSLIPGVNVQMKKFYPTTVYRR